jgi:hypothetical protein
VIAGGEENLDGRGIGERSDAVLRTAMPGHDGKGGRIDNAIGSVMMVAVPKTIRG